MIKDFDGTLIDEAGMICNFLPVIEKVYHHSSHNSWAVKLSILQRGQIRNLGLKTEASLKNIDFESLSPSYLCSRDDGKSTKKLVLSYIRRMVSEIALGEVPGVLFEQMGWQMIDNNSYVFVAGDRVISNTELQVDYAIAPDVARYHLHDNSQIEKKQAIKIYLKMLKRNPEVLIPLSAHLLRSTLGTLFSEAGFPQRHVLYIAASQGVGKTTAAANFCAPYSKDRSCREAALILSANGTKSAVRHALSDVNDTTVILDDICISTDSDTQRSAKSLAANMIRLATNDAPPITREGHSVKEHICKAGLVITGEFPMETESDITRCVMVSISEQMKDGQANDRDITAMALSYFLEYISGRYLEIRDRIKLELTEFLSDLELNSRRQQAILAELSCAFKLLLDFAVEAQALKPEKHDCWSKRLQNALERCLSFNNMQLRELAQQDIRLAPFLLDAVENKALSIAKSKKSFKNNVEGYDGVSIDKNHICIRLDAIVRLWEQETSMLTSEKCIGKMLRDERLVFLGKENKTANFKQKGYPRMVKLSCQLLQQQAKNAV